ncbi:MAG: hypothetical protein Q4D80_05720 [Pseudomonadota bacterium]|nr:hypothetical protein [Pseudomonadota bacterium]
MSKLKQSMAVTAILAGLVLYTVPVQGAPCFLPSGTGGCEAGGVDIASDNGSDETCEGYNISENTRNSKQYSSGCYSCSACTNKAGKKMYKCEAVSNATWDNSHGVCCTNGEKYDVAERKCCPSGGCVHDDCEEPKIWSPSLQSCECPSNRDENDAGECCNVGEHADGSICCPTNKHNQNGTCVCDDGYIPDGTGCKLPNCGGYDVTDTSKYDTNCYTCEACADDGKKFKCTQSIKDGYKLDSGKCIKKQSCADYGLASETSCDKSKNTFTANKTDDFGNKCGTCVENGEEKSFHFELITYYAEGAGKYYMCGLKGSNFIVMPQNQYYNNDYNSCGRTDPSIMEEGFPDCSEYHKTMWEGDVYSSDSTHDYDADFILPVDMKIVMTYDVPCHSPAPAEGQFCTPNTEMVDYAYYSWDKCSWDRKGTYAPRTVSITMPAGTDTGKTNTITVPAIDYSVLLQEAPERVKVKYYVGGKELPEGANTLKVGNITYEFEIFDENNPCGTEYPIYSSFRPEDTKCHVYEQCPQLDTYYKQSRIYTQGWGIYADVCRQTTCEDYGYVTPEFGIDFDGYCSNSLQQVREIRGLKCIYCMPIEHSMCLTFLEKNYPEISQPVVISSEELVKCDSAFKCEAPENCKKIPESVGVKAYCCYEEPTEYSDCSKCTPDPFSPRNYCTSTGDDPKQKIFCSESCMPRSELGSGDLGLGGFVCGPIAN